MTTPNSHVKIGLIATFLFLGAPIIGLSYLIWDLPGLFFGGGTCGVGLGILSLVSFQKKSLTLPFSSQALMTEEQPFYTERELLWAREEELALLEQRFLDVEAFAEEKEAKVDQLRKQVEELKGEIRRLLELEPIPESEMLTPGRDPEEEAWVDTLGHSARREVLSRFDAHSLLKQCLELAESLKGVRHLAGHSKRFEALSMGNYAIDLRQLFEAFRGEARGVVAIYSQKEDRFLFVSNLIRGLLGWGPERFIRDFSWLIRKGEADWKEAMGALALSEEAHLEMAFRSASDEEIQVGCALGAIPRGAFTGLIIAILYPLGESFNE